MHRSYPKRAVLYWLMNRLVVIIVVLLTFVKETNAQWKFVREDSNVQPYIYNVRSLNNKFYIQGPSIAHDGTAGYAAFHLSELDNAGNLIFDTLHGNSNVSHLIFLNVPIKKLFQYSFSVCGRRNQAETGNLIVGQYGIVFDTNHAVKIIPAFENYPPNSGMAAQTFGRINDNRFLSIATLRFADVFYTQDLYIRVVDSLGSILKEKILSIPNRNLFITDYHEFDGFYYFPITRNQLHPNYDAGADYLSTIMIYKMDTANLELVNSYTEPGLKYGLYYGSAHLDNGDFFIPTQKKVVSDPLGINNLYQKTLMKFDKNLNKIWEVSFGSIYSPATRELMISQDNHIVGIGQEWEDELGKACLFKFDTTGNQLWQRNYVAVQPINQYGTNTSVYSFDLVNDGGFILSGNNLNHWPHKDRGWVMRVNCLGFLGSPQAALTHAYLDNYQLNFSNNSTEAGSFTWIFDDGAIYHTTEHDSDIQHTFENPEVEHTVTLIAHGCNGEADTLVYTVPIHPDFLPEQPEPLTPENGYFAIYPNPAQVGSDIKIVMNAQANAQEVAFEFHNNTGQLAARYEVPNQSVIYMIYNEFAQGMYHVSMKVDGKVVVRKKFVVGG